jgi:hypothetical protein
MNGGLPVFGRYDISHGRVKRWFNTFSSQKKKTISAKAKYQHMSTDDVENYIVERIRISSTEEDGNLLEHMTLTDMRSFARHVIRLVNSSGASDASAVTYSSFKQKHTIAPWMPENFSSPMSRPLKKLLTAVVNGVGSSSVSAAVDHLGEVSSSAATTTGVSTSISTGGEEVTRREDEGVYHVMDDTDADDNFLCDNDHDTCLSFQDMCHDIMVAMERDNNNTNSGGGGGSSCCNNRRPSDFECDSDNNDSDDDD